eukprot:1100555-Amphidinium_carterae.1
MKVHHSTRKSGLVTTTSSRPTAANGATMQLHHAPAFNSSRQRTQHLSVPHIPATVLTKCTLAVSVCLGRKGGHSEPHVFDDFLVSKPCLGQLGQ